MGTPTVSQKGTALPTQQTGATQQAPTQQTGKGTAQQVSKDTFQAPTQAQKGVAVPKGVVKGATQGACETSPTAPTSTSEDTCARIEDKTKHFFANVSADLAGKGAEIESAIDNLEHMLGDFAAHVKSLLTKDNKTTSAGCSGGTAEATTSTCSTQGTQAQGQAQAGAQAQFSKGGKGLDLPTQQTGKGALPTQQAPVQQSKGAPVQQAPVKGAPTQQAPVQKGGK